MNLGYKFISLLLVGFFAFFGVEKANEKVGQLIKINHKVSIVHPGISDSEAIEYTLVEVNQDVNTANYFYMDVESVVCGSQVCKVDIVRLFWDELGQFTKLKMLNNSALEKNEGILFTKEDYNKLDVILSDVNSPLQNFYKHELVNDSHANAADAYSGATVVINNNAIVEGAVWTCYTLWHWANGDVVSQIREITSSNYKNEALKAFLQSSNINYRVFALEQCIAKKLVQSDYLNQVVSMSFTSKKEVELMLAYLEFVNADAYGKSIHKLFKIYNKNQRVLLLNALIKTKQVLPTSFLEPFSANIVEEEFYQNIYLMLELFSIKKVNSPIVNQHVLELLNNESILISRSAYYFLKGQKLESKSLVKLKSFESENKDRL